MRQLLILTALVLGLSLSTVGQGSAYEFTEAERQVAADDSRRLSQQQADNQARQYQRQNDEQDQRWQREQKQFDPRAYDSPAPYNLYQNGGRAQVCRRNASGMVFCQ